MTDLQELDRALHVHCPSAELVDTTDRQDLVVAVGDISSKEILVLRSLLKVMDGKNHFRLRFSEKLTDCNIALLPMGARLRLPADCVVVYLIPEGEGAIPDHPGLSIRAPLRLSNTSVLLQAAAELLNHGGDDSPSGNKLAALVSVLLRNIMARERRTTFLALGEEHNIIVNFLEDRYYCAMPTDSLLEGKFALHESRRASDGELSLISLQPGARLRELLWHATHRLGDAAAPGDTLSGKFRLRRWPDAMAVSRPGFPMLAALLTKHPHSVEQASKVSGASPAAVSWFLRTNLALGIAEVVDLVEPAPAVHEPVVVHAIPVPSMLNRIRDRLKLW